MATLQEFMKFSEMAITDKTSLGRMKEIVGVLHKYDFPKGLTPEKAVHILEELGPTFVKLGQLASTRADMLPKKYCEAFNKLHANVDPLPFDTVTSCINEAYAEKQLSVDKVFKTIEEAPLGSASIAQVHLAYLQNGEKVAIKVRRPNIVQRMAEDLTLMRHVLVTAEFVVNSQENLLYSAKNFLDELEETTINELDFTQELSHLLKFQEMAQSSNESLHAAWQGVTSPKAYADISTEAVLVMEYVEGTQIDQSDTLKPAGYDMDELANRLVQNYVSQVLDAGFFHADPHAGNIMVRDENIVWLDLGMVGTLTGAERTLVGNMFHAVATKDEYVLMEAVTGLCKRNGKADTGLLLSQLSGMLDKYSAASMGDIDMGSTFNEIIDILQHQNLIMSPAVTMLVRGFSTIQGVLETISPTTSVISIVSSHVVAQMTDPSSLKDRAIKMATAAAASAEASAKLPTQLSQTLEMLDHGELSVKTNIEVEREVLNSVYSSIGRLSLAGISMGLFIGSSILCMTNMEPRILEVPVIGFLGYLGAFVLSVYVIAITLKNRHKMLNGEKVE